LILIDFYDHSAYDSNFFNLGVIFCCRTHWQLSIRVNCGFHIHEYCCL